MPTTCGFPNCKFRSRYRGQEDNRHFYRIPKRPLVLRQRWLKAIGRTEETVVSQLRICSAHFEGGEKKEGDIPVPDPQLDSPLSIQLPPKETKSSERRRTQKSYSSNHQATTTTTNSSSSSADTTLCGTNDRNRRGGGHFSNFTGVLPADPSCIYATSTNPTNTFGSEFLSNIAATKDEKDSNKDEFATRFSRYSPNGIKFFPGFPVIFPMVNRFQSGMKPLVALLDGRDCSVEMPLLKDIATVAFCDAQATSEIHEKVLNEAVAALMWNTIKLEQSDLEKFKALKLIICLGSDTGNVNVKAATDFGIAVCNTPGICIDEVADSTMSMILNLFRKTHWLSKMMENGKTANGIEQIRELSSGSKRIRDSVLGIIGLGQVGSAVVIRAKTFGFKIIFYDPLVSEGAEKVFGIERCDTLDALLKRSDCVSLHCSHNSKTSNILNEETIKKLKFGAFVVNTGRPELINETALVSALRTGHVKAAALDIQHILDTNCATQLAATGQIIQTARTSWLSEESAHELRVAAAKELRRALTGRIPHDLSCCINKDQLTTKNNDSSYNSNNHIGSSASSSTPNQAFNSLQSLGFPAAVSDAYNGLSMSTSFASLPYTNPLLMNPQLLMSNPALGNFPFSGVNPTSLAFGNAASRLLSQSPKSTTQSNSNKRSISGASTPANNQAASANRSPSSSPIIPPANSSLSQQQNNDDDDNMITVKNNDVVKNDDGGDGGGGVEDAEENEITENASEAKKMKLDDDEMNAASVDGNEGAL
jgi:C-terminal binding protein